MKRVYVVFESSSDSYWNEVLDDWFYLQKNYEDRFIDVYESYPAAVQSIREWAKSFSNVVHRRSDSAFEEVVLIDENSPYSNEDKIWLKREVKSTLLKSS